METKQPQSLILEGIKLYKQGEYPQAIEKLQSALDNITDKSQNQQEQCCAQNFIGLCLFEQTQTNSDKTTVIDLLQQAQQHFEISLNLAKGLKDEQQRTQKQLNAQHWIGRGLFEQALRNNDETTAIDLLQQAQQHFEINLNLAKDLTDEQKRTQEQLFAQFWIGRSFLEQALRNNDETTAIHLLQQAQQHFETRLNLAEGLTDEQKRTQEQLSAQFWIGHSLLEQALRNNDETAAINLLQQAQQHFEKNLNRATGLEDEQKRTQEQLFAQFWIGRSLLEQALRNSDETTAIHLLQQAQQHFETRLNLAEGLKDEQKRTQEQLSAQFGIGRCLLEQALRNNDETAAIHLLQQAQQHFEINFNLAKDLEDEQKRTQEQLSTQYWIGRCLFGQTQKVNTVDNFRTYLNIKAQNIQIALFPSKNGSAVENIATILAVLNIEPIELGKKTLAHYTNHKVCASLFGLNKKSHTNDHDEYEKPNSMRMGSATYMNDPSEGQSLLDLLGQYHLGLENKTNFSPAHAFFTCFSARINDLNQFRLYGKEDGVEASGCCLIFNQQGDWLETADISAANMGLSSTQTSDDIDTTTMLKKPSNTNTAQNTPLYQVAYIAYKDEHIGEEQCDIWLPSKENTQFGVHLKPLNDNHNFHTARKEKLQDALTSLIKQTKSTLSPEDKKALEYIRYLFKDFAFRDEEEFRLLKIVEIDSEQAHYCNNSNTIYIEYDQIGKMVDEVILGTNYEKTNSKHKVEVFRYLMKKRHPKIKLTHSFLPINANPPTPPAH